MSDGGTYTLLIDLPESAEIEVGALGTPEFDPGAYAYVGSALGSGGFARVDRHRRLAAGEHDARHWHVDYLLGHPASRLVEVVTSAGIDAECEVAREIEGERVPGFGASDCTCDSHLVYAPEGEGLRRRAREAHERVRQ